jgi:hydroxyethylthiazole kinase
MLTALMSRVQSKKPLVHHITNMVTVNDCANVTLAIGGLPVMAHAPEEVEEMVAAAQALVLNIGTLSREQVDAMIKAGKAANSLGIPVVLDPVGAGATSMRTESARKILDEVSVAVVKGNSAEISTLAGSRGEIRGVEAVGESCAVLDDAVALAKEYGNTVVVSGATDVVTDGRRAAYVENGHPLMGTITGTGCMLASVVASFVAVEEECFAASVAALTAFGLAGELAAAGSGVRGPATFKTCFFDELYNLTTEKLKKGARYRINTFNGKNSNKGVEI